tara:strand:- start:477 stop:770 length:294 start_codon:yes stop_codon:yes gene_type:complete
MLEDILNLKKFLLNPKRSDNFDTWYYLEGWRVCNIKIGNKKGVITSLFGGSKVTLNIKQLKEELNKLYWYAASCDASRVAHEQGRKKKKLRWEQEYA